MERIQRGEAERERQMRHQYTAAGRAFFGGKKRRCCDHGNNRHRHDAAAQQADAPGEESIPHGGHNLRKLVIAANAQQLLDAARQHCAVA